MSRRYPVRPHQPLFASRLDAGEELYFRRPFGPEERDLEHPLGDVLCVAISDGAVEAAYPWAYLLGHTLRPVPPRALDRWLHDARDRPCIVIDDGLSAAADLRRAVLALRRSGASTVRLAAPALPLATRQALRGLDLGRIVTVVPSTRVDVASRLYAQAPVSRSVAAALAAECGRSPAPFPAGAVAGEAAVAPF